MVPVCQVSFPLECASSACAFEEREQAPALHDDRPKHSTRVVFNHQPGDQLKISRFISLVPLIWNHSVSICEECRRHPLPKCHCDGFNDFPQENIIMRHVSPVLSLAIKKITQSFDGRPFPGAEFPVHGQNLFRMSKPKTDISIGKDVNEKIGFKGINLVRGFA